MLGASAAQRVDEASRTISAYFNEILATGGDWTAAPGAAVTWSEEKVERSEKDRSERVSLRQFCLFLAHYRVLSQDFSHRKALEVFTAATGGDPEELLDLAGFRDALQAVAEGVPKDFCASRALTAGALDGSPDVTSPSATRKADLLEELLTEINARRVTTLDAEAGELLGPLYDMEVTLAIHSYLPMLLALYNHYATTPTEEESGPSSPTGPARRNSAGRTAAVKSTEPATLGARSLYLLAHACGLVPSIVVPGELADIVAQFSVIRDRGANTPAERTERRRFIDDGRMLAMEDDQKFISPAKGFSPGEPRYLFADLIELMATAAFSMPPRPYDEEAPARAGRIHEVFGRAMGWPTGPLVKEGGALGEALFVRKYLADLAEEHGDESELAAAERKSRRHSAVGGLKGARPPSSLREVLVKLSEELPLLPEKQEQQLPEPPLAKAADLEPQPPTIDELLLLPPGSRGGDTGGGGKKKGGKKKKAGSKKGPSGPIEFDKVIFYAKRSTGLKLDIPPQLQTERRAQGLQELDLRLLWKSQQPQRLAAPESGGLRLALIDEPLRAPLCALSEEVSTLMETALAARRLRQYCEAIALLIRARRLWAALAMGRRVPMDWADVQPLVPAPSPWGHGIVSAAGQAQRSEEGHCSRTCHQPIGSARETTTSILKGTGVFRRFNATCAGSHLLRKPGATAALAASSRGASGLETPSRLPHEDSGDLASARVAPPAATAAQPRVIRTDSGGTEEPAKSSSDNSSMASSRPASAKDRESFARGSKLEPRPPIKRYDPLTDFKLATADEDGDLDCLPHEAALFFFCELASLHLAIREDDLAAQLLWRARGPSEKLPAQHPDAAAVWCGLGRVAYLAGAYDVAARSISKARGIREHTLGGDTVETATAYNNLGCSLFALDRPQEGFVYLELAEELLRVIVGEDHPRALTALRNCEKARAAQKSLQCDVPHLFSYYVKQVKLGGKAKKKKKKGSRGSSSGSSKKSKK